MSKVVNDTYDHVNGALMTIADILALLEKIDGNKDGKLLKSLKKDIGDDKHGFITSMDDALYGRVIQEMEKQGVPFFAYDVVGSTKKYILVSGKREQEMKDIMNQAKIRYGYEIDTKEELDDAISRNAINPQEQAYKNLSPEMAERILEKARKHHVTAVKQEEPDGTYSVYSSVDDKEKMNRFVYSAAWDLTGKSGEIESRRLKYMLNEKREIEEALGKGTNLDEAYIFSASNPNCYIHITDTGYEYIKGGQISAKLREDQDPVNYIENLKFQIQRINNAVYMPKAEVESKGGPESSVIKEEVLGTLFEKHLTKEDGYTIQAEKELRNWIENKFSVGTDENYEQAKKYMESINLNEFQMELSKKCNTPEKEEYYNRIISHSDNFNSHIQSAAKVLETIDNKTIMLQRELSLTIDVAQKSEEVETTTETRTYEH